MLSLTYIEDAPGLSAEPAGMLKASDNTVLQVFPRDQPGYAAPEAALSAVIQAWLDRRTSPTRPVVVMVHGFMYDPSSSPSSPDNPFDTIYGVPPRTNYHLSWLPLVGECDDKGV